MRTEEIFQTPSRRTVDIHNTAAPCLIEPDRRLADNFEHSGTIAERGYAGIAIALSSCYRRDIMQAAFGRKFSAALPGSTDTRSRSFRQRPLMGERAGYPSVGTLH